MALCPVIGKLLQKRVVLASASPRRREILSNAGLRFEVVPSRFKEKLDKASFSTPYAYAMETARQKALEVANRMHQKDLRTPDVVIGADTIVAVSGLILEKPADKQDAYRMLSRLSGKEHSVFTGVAIVHCSSKDGQLDAEVSEFYEETTVKFSELSEELLWEYIHSGEPMDKAGGYGIQALGGMLVEHIRGDFLNVVGFPLNRFCKKLVELYYPPRREDLPRASQDSIPPVDTFENLSDVEAGGSEPGQREAAAGGDRQAGATPKADGSRTAEPPPFPADLLELIDGFKASKALFTACKLKLFDFLRDEASRKAVDVAGKVDASVCGTERLLDACATLGLLQKSEQGYRNTESSNLYLVSDGEHSLHDFIMYNDQHTWNLFTHLELAIREGTNQHHGALGTTAPDLFQDGPLQSKEDQLRVTGAMHGLATLTAAPAATAFDLSRFSSACHLGACTAALARELAREYPRLQVAVFDLPHVLEHASRCQPGGPGTARITFLAGDVFRDSLPRAELYVLSGVLQGWPEDGVHTLLRRVADTPGAGLLLVEAVGDVEDREARAGLSRCLDALLRPRARERSVADYRRLLEQHGFGDVQVAPMGHGLAALLGTRVARLDRAVPALCGPCPQAEGGPGPRRWSADSVNTRDNVTMMTE
ncbi:LOW QUALITY PROTEIN: probable bifunctional dTTP/UTP pyrophosphatase/methyltransferase protein [Lemur catta]|uniref:LOW QUALITY PROTEIN: probable bifunctional dTTP/UTP pyrophosphatase/methyltransferase protein n=1 Tax=Lemur catta TaxID=9447 RepID=UPI001E2698E1|nr:LOW QUALITY PROTEIN: probable bifunctional dTTP/UTP pyrophosphatase/methyltransferase protein [Lemur catta]